MSGTHGHGASTGSALSGSQGPTPPGGPPRQHSGRILGAALLVGALAGGATGIGGAAALGVFDDNPAVTTSSEQGGSHSGSTQLQVDRSAQGTAVDSSATEAAAQKVLPSVVQIYVTSPSGSGTGSGVVISPQGEILTNNHVVARAAEQGTIAVSFSNGRSARADVIGTDPLTDLAVIKVDGVEGLQPATFGSSDSLDVGEPVVAVGAPYGLKSTVTSGIVSALDRPVTAPSQSGDRQATVFPAIQTDAAINPGNSGGPLINLSGQIIGINSAIQTAPSESPYGSGSGGSIGLGFAIPADDALPIVQQLRQGKSPTHALMGVRVGGAADQIGLPNGARVASVTPGSAASDAGLSRGDVVTEVNSERISDPDSLVATIRTYRPGETVTVTYQPAGGGDTARARLTLESDAGA